VQELGFEYCVWEFGGAGSGVESGGVVDYGAALDDVGIYKDELCHAHFEHCQVGEHSQVVEQLYQDVDEAIHIVGKGHFNEGCAETCQADLNVWFNL
jgi:hypothetical protein